MGRGWNIVVLPEHSETLGGEFMFPGELNLPFSTRFAQCVKVQETKIAKCDKAWGSNQ